MISWYYGYYKKKLPYITAKLDEKFSCITAKLDEKFSCITAKVMKKNFVMGQQKNNLNA